jgi:hypothetical protein
MISADFSDPFHPVLLQGLRLTALLPLSAAPL